MPVKVNSDWQGFIWLKKKKEKKNSDNITQLLIMKNSIVP